MFALRAAQRLCVGRPVAALWRAPEGFAARCAPGAAAAPRGLHVLAQPARAGAQLVETRSLLSGFARLFVYRARAPSAARLAPRE